MNREHSSVIMFIIINYNKNKNKKVEAAEMKRMLLKWKRE